MSKEENAKTYPKLKTKTFMIKPPVSPEEKEEKRWCYHILNETPRKILYAPVRQISFDEGGYEKRYIKGCYESDVIFRLIEKNMITLLSKLLSGKIKMKYEINHCSHIFFAVDLERVEIVKLILSKENLIRNRRMSPRYRVGDFIYVVELCKNKKIVEHIRTLKHLSFSKLF